jgi:glutamine---fructose-6-phosphate transaminase (isomerizing)
MRVSLHPAGDLSHSRPGMIAPLTATEREIAIQPDVWRRMVERAPTDGPRLLGSGRALVMGCGTSAFVANAVAALREGNGAGQTDWSYASEVPRGRTYDHVLAISRSGTTTEVLDALRDLPPSTHRVAVVAVDGEITRSIAALVDEVIVLAEADEASVVQTRFPTAVLALVRASLGDDAAGLPGQAERALAIELRDPSAYEQFVFLGRGWTVGLADEAALKFREMALAWSESYPAMDYRHGPIALAGDRTLVVPLGELPPGLAQQIAATGAVVLGCDLDPLGQLVVCQRLALALALSRGLDPDRPNRLVRSVVLDG